MSEKEDSGGMFTLGFSVACKNRRRSVAKLFFILRELVYSSETKSIRFQDAKGTQAVYSW